MIALTTQSKARQLAISVFAILLLTGCQTLHDQRTFMGYEARAYSSPMTEMEASELAQSIASTVNGAWTTLQGTGSMRPILDDNVIIVWIVRWHKLAIGQIVIWYDGNAYICHRIVHRNPDGTWYSAGYNVRVGLDYQPVTRENYLGTVVAIIPFTL